MKEKKWRKRNEWKEMNEWRTEGRKEGKTEEMRNVWVNERVSECPTYYFLSDLPTSCPTDFLPFNQIV